MSQRKGCIFAFTAGRLVLPMLETEWRCEGEEGKTTKEQVGQTRHILKFIFVVERKHTKTLTREAELIREVENNLINLRKTIANEFGISSCTDAVNHHYYHHQFLNREGRWGTTDNFATSFLHFSLLSTALWDLPISRLVHSPMLSSHLFLCPPCLPLFTVPCKMVLARPDERET